MKPELIAVIILLMCCSSSVGASFMMGDGVTGPTGPTGPVLPKARYVTLTFVEGTSFKYILSPYEVRVLDKSGTNLALSGTISDVSEHFDESLYPPGAIIDDDETTMWHSHHYGDNTDFITIDLGADKEIAKIEVINDTRTTVYNGVPANARMSGGGPDSPDRGAYVELKNTTGSVVKTTPDIKTVADKYTITFPENQWS